MSADYPVDVLYDVERRMVGCVILAAAAGCPLWPVMAIPAEHWLVAPTPAMRRYSVRDKAQMDALIARTTGTNR